MNAPHSPRVVVMLVPDLFFAAKIRTAAQHLGVEVVPTEAARLVDDCRARTPARVIVDLHAGAAALVAVRALKADPALAGVPVTGFYSHVDDATRQAALAAGVDQAMPRSAFTAKLAELLAG
jgi:DNA-binding NarL/FixJ family response regulator